MQQYQARDHEVFNNAHSTEHYGVRGEMDEGLIPSMHVCVFGCRSRRRGKDTSYYPASSSSSARVLLLLFVFLLLLLRVVVRRQATPKSHSSRPPPLPCAPLPSSMPDGVGCTPRGGSGGKKVLRVYGLEVQGSGRTSINMITCQPQNPNV